jgi:hypothetical protein
MDSYIGYSSSENFYLHKIEIYDEIMELYMSTFFSQRDSSEKRVLFSDECDQIIQE